MSEGWIRVDHRQDADATMRRLEKTGHSVDQEREDDGIEAK